jgi:glycine oxidase
VIDDCLIIGAGVIGLSLAYELSGQGLRVRLLDRRNPGAEASWAGAGILPPAPDPTTDSPLDQLSAMSAKLHPQWAERLREETGIDTQYRPCGAWHLDLQQQVVGWAESARPTGVAGAGGSSRSPGSSATGASSAADSSRGHSFDFTRGHPIVPLEKLQSREPALAEAIRSGVITAAAFAADEAQLRNPRHLAALAEACRRRGVQIEESVEVTGFWSSAGQIVGAQTSSGPKYAGTFCITSGAWSGRLASTIGVSIPIKPIRGQMVLLDHPQPPIHSIVNVGKCYLVPRLDGHVLVGSTEENAGFDKNTTEEAIAGLLNFAHQLLPAWRSANVERTWAGLRPATPDEIPYLGRAPAFTNLFIAAGHFRNGLFWSPATAVLMTELIRGQKPVIDLAPFRVDR